jgi:hypothetical protein
MPATGPPHQEGAPVGPVDPLGVPDHTHPQLSPAERQASQLNPARRGGRWAPPQQQEPGVCSPAGARQLNPCGYSE